MGPRETLRIDKWLWQARFFKTRALAARTVQGGRVRVDSVPVSKASRAVGVGDVLTFVAGERVRVVRIAALGARRGPAVEARALYEDLTPEAPAPDPGAPRAGARPSGRERRRMEALRDPPGT
ncbi:MAG: RNA-binding S4 domain-containing protein [Paracoccaceae bacterium]